MIVYAEAISCTNDDDDDGVNPEIVSFRQMTRFYCDAKRRGRLLTTQKRASFSLLKKGVADHEMIPSNFPNFCECHQGV